MSCLKCLYIKCGLVVVLLGESLATEFSQSADLGTTLGENEVDKGDTSQDGHGNLSHSHDENHRYSVAVVDFNHVAVPFLITGVIICASLAKIGFHLKKRLSSIFPESCLLILIGIIVGTILYFSNVDDYEMDSSTFFLYLLPPIILEAGYFMPARSFIDNLGTILLFAVIGTLWNTLLIGVSLWGLSMTSAINTGEISILHCLVFSSLLSAVDPVAVLAVFEVIHVNEILHIVVFGESLLNDAVTVVLYHMFESYSEIGEENIQVLDIVSGFFSFFIVGLGGIFIGIIIGFLTAFMTRFTDHVRVIEPLLVFVMGYLSYLTAEIFHLSGILACVSCGMIMKKYVEKNISQKSHTTIKYFMKMMASVCETIIFMFLGISTVTNNHSWESGFVLLTLIFCLVYRAIGVIVLSWCANRVRLIPLSGVDQFIMAYGGLRGAIAFSLVILLDEKIFPQKKLFITTTVVVVYFTVFVQGITIKPLVNILRVKKAEKRKPTMNEKLNDRLVDHMMAGIEDIAGYHGHHELRERYQRLDNQFIKPLLIREKKMIDRGQSLVHVYQKLEEKDAHEFLQKNGSFVLSEQFLRPNDISRTCSLAQLIHQYSGQPNGTNVSSNPTGSGASGSYSIPMPDNLSSTCLDMRALEPSSPPAIHRQDTSIHHLLDNSLFEPRTKFIPHQRHMLPSSENHQPFHHKARLHLRHLMSPKKYKSSTSSHHSRTKSKGKSVTSFTTTPSHNNNNKLMVNQTQKPPHKSVSFVNEVTITVEPATPVRPLVGAAIPTEDNESSASEEGIIFTVSSEDNIRDTSPKTPDNVTAAETMLPWRRYTTSPTLLSHPHSCPNIQDLVHQPLSTWLEPQNDKKPLISPSSSNNTNDPQHQLPSKERSQLEGSVNYALNDSVFTSNESDVNNLNCDDNSKHAQQVNNTSDNNTDNSQQNTAAKSSHKPQENTYPPESVVVNNLFNPEMLATKRDYLDTVTSSCVGDDDDGRDNANSVKEDESTSLPLPWKCGGGDQQVGGCGGDDGVELESESEVTHIPEADTPQLAPSYRLKPLPQSDGYKLGTDGTLLEDPSLPVDDVSPILPPPWRNFASNSEEIFEKNLEGGQDIGAIGGLQSSTPYQGEMAVKTEVEEDEDAEEDEEVEALVTEGICSGESHTSSIRAPWRQLSEVSLDRIRSPSVAITLDSMCPHPSTHSFIISEAESHHSQHILHVSKLIEKPNHHHNNGHHSDHDDVDTDLGLDHVDNDQFVANWILGCEPDLDLPTHDIIQPHSSAAALHEYEHQLSNSSSGGGTDENHQHRGDGIVFVGDDHKSHAFVQVGRGVLASPAGSNGVGGNIRKTELLPRTISSGNGTGNCQGDSTKEKSKHKHWDAAETTKL